MMKKGLKRMIFNVCERFVKEYKKDLSQSKLNDEKLHHSLHARIHQIQENNAKNIVYNKLIPEVIKETLEKENYLISESQAFQLALQRFVEHKNTGKLDELNRYVTKSSKVKGE